MVTASRWRRTVKRSAAGDEERSRAKHAAAVRWVAITTVSLRVGAADVLAELARVLRVAGGVDGHLAAGVLDVARGVDGAAARVVGDAVVVDAVAERIERLARSG